MNSRAESPMRMWRDTLALIALTLAVLGYCYRETFMAMAEIWWRSETYTHGLLVPFISGWLVWRSRHRITRLMPQAWLWPLVLLGISVFAWLLGEITAVNALTQFSIVAIVVVSCMTLLGKTISKELAFPFVFLFFAVPIGDFLMPRLMEWTADFTVIAVRLSGIPVYREGQNFVIPSGNWSVVEACSGIRYLIASLTIGTLYAYLTYTSLKRRMIFIGVSILVPIFANWLRAYMIVMLGHLSGNKLAVGVDHLIYGWIFFGVVIAIMFAIGMRWSEPETHEAPLSVPEAMPSSGHETRPIFLSTFIIILMLVAGPIAKDRIQGGINSLPPSLETPQAAGAWQSTSRLVDLQPHFDNPSVEKHETFKSGNQQVGFYIAYYRNQDFDRKLVTSTNAIVTTTNPAWQLAASGTQTLEGNARITRVKTFELVHKSGAIDDRYVAWQWYWVNGRFTSSEIEAKWLTAWSMLSGLGDDSAAVIIYAPKAVAAQALAAFSHDMTEVIHASLARTQSR